MDFHGHEVLVILGCRLGHVVKVKVKVADLTEELSLVDIPLLARGAEDMGIHIEQSDTLKIVATFDNGYVVGVSYKLSVVVLNYGGVYFIGAPRKIDDSALRECIATFLAVSRLGVPG